jgi:UDP-N-acetylenolpyruvoylglucosamine reductase
MEVQDALFQLEAFDFATGEMLVLDKAACQFAYRDSIFKHALKDRVAITSVQFALPNNGSLKLAMPMSPDICNCKRSAPFATRNQRCDYRDTSGEITRSAGDR